MSRHRSSNRRRLAALLIACGLLVVPAAVHAVPDSISYQGQLSLTDGPANGSFDFTFRLFDASTGGAPVGSVVNANGVTVTDGLFSAPLSFGSAPFDGSARWLEIAVRPAGSSDPHTVLQGRVPILTVPYAHRAATAANAEQLAGQPASAYAAATHTHSQLVRAGDGQTVVSISADGSIALQSGGAGIPGAVVIRPLAGAMIFRSTDGEQQLQVSLPESGAINLSGKGVSTNPALRMAAGSGIGDIPGGSLQLESGEGFGTGNGGDIVIAAGNGGPGAGTRGGNISLRPGNSQAGGIGKVFALGSEFSADGIRIRGLSLGMDGLLGGTFGQVVMRMLDNQNGSVETTAGSLTVKGSDASDTNFNRSGSLFLQGGRGSEFAEPGNVEIAAGDGSDPANPPASGMQGGDVVVRGGKAVGGADLRGGDIVLVTGNPTGSGRGGRVQLNGPMSVNSVLEFGPEVTLGRGATNQAVLGRADGSANFTFNLADPLAPLLRLNVADGTGVATVRAGTALTTTVRGADLLLAAGNGQVVGFSGSAAGGHVTLKGGNANRGGTSTASPLGGDAIVEGGNGLGFARGGNVILRPGNTGLIERPGVIIDSIKVSIGTGTVAADGRTIDVSNGAFLSSGGVWTNASDRNSKTDFQDVDPREVLAKLLNLPVTKWRYQAEGSNVLRMGPMAQDFHEAFGLGIDDRSIGAVDADGVAFAAIQGLHEVTSDRIRELEAENAALRARLDLETSTLNQRLAALEAALATLQGATP